MIKILFVCHGNICRSPMAEFVMKKLVEDKGLAAEFQIASAATSTEELGNPVYPPARKKLAEHGISCADKVARQLTKQDYAEYDLLIGMDSANIRNMEIICHGDPEHKIHLLMEYAGSTRDVADPWYTRDFEATWQDVVVGCEGIKIQTQKPLSLGAMSKEELDSALQKGLDDVKKGRVHTSAEVKARMKKGRI